MSWYRTYRPSSLAGLHLTAVREQVQDLLGRGQLPQVWLLTGPKGTGKTSTARILAAMLNLPKNEKVVREYFFSKGKKNSTLGKLLDPDPTLPDQATILQGTSYVVQEWDAASHRGIDDVRTLKEQVALPPQLGVMNVYILDEVHMLTTEAFNALLKLLEEPPQHAIFMLATTERHKVPETIISRATVVEFRQASVDELLTVMQSILQAEGITFDQPALELLAEAANGSFRDGVKLLEQVATGRSHLDLSAVTMVAGDISSEVQDLMLAVVNRQPEKVVAQCQAWRTTGRNPDFVYRQILGWLYEQVLIGLGVHPGTAHLKQPVALFLLNELQVLPGWATTPIPLLPLEVKLLDLILRAQQKRSGSTSPASPAEPGPHTPARSTSPTSAASQTDIVATATPSVSTAAQVTANQVVVETVLPTEDDNTNLEPVSLGTAQRLLEQWETFVQLVQEKNTTIAAVLRSAKPLETDANHAKIAVFYKFHYEQLKQPKFQKLFEESAAPITGGLTQLEFILQAAPPASEANPSLTSLAEQVLV